MADEGSSTTTISWSPGGNNGVHRRVELYLPGASAQTGRNAEFVRAQRLSGRRTGQGGHATEVELVADEAEQFVEDAGQAPLPVPLRNEPDGDVVGVDHQCGPARCQAGGGQVVGILHRGHDVRAGGTGPGPVIQEQQDLDDIDVAVVADGRQHHDRRGGVRADEFQIRPCERVSGAAYDAGAAGVGHAHADRVCHGDLVVIGGGHDA